MLARPKVMLVDEPAAGLNNREIENAMALLDLAAKKYNIGVLLIEHSMDMIMNSCSNIVVINFGKMICEEDQKGSQRSSGHRGLPRKGLDA